MSGFYKGKNAPACPNFAHSARGKVECNTRERRGSIVSSKRTRRKFRVPHEGTESGRRAVKTRKLRLPSIADEAFGAVRRRAQCAAKVAQAFPNKGAALCGRCGTAWPAAGEQPGGHALQRQAQLWGESFPGRDPPQRFASGNIISSQFFVVNGGAGFSGDATKSRRLVEIKLGDFNNEFVSWMAQSVAHGKKPIFDAGILGWIDRPDGEKKRSAREAFLGGEKYFEKSA